jgi:uncharacterized protein DUF6350
MAPDLDKFDEPGPRTNKPANATEPATEPEEPTKDPARPTKDPAHPEEASGAARPATTEPVELPAPGLHEAAAAGKTNEPVAEPHDFGLSDPGLSDFVRVEKGVPGLKADPSDPNAPDPESEAHGPRNPGPDPSDPEAIESEPGAIGPGAEGFGAEPEAFGAESEAFGAEPGAVGPESGAFGAEPDAVEPEPEAFEPEPPPEPVSTMAKVRALTILAVGPLVTGYLAIATLLAVITGMASNARFTTSGVLNAALPGWLAAHQVPIDIFGLELGVLPLLPTIGVAFISGRAAARAAERLDLRNPGQAGVVIGTVVVAHAIAGLVVAGLSVDAVVSANPLTALYYPALVAGLAATIGVARRCGLVDGLARRADVAAVEGLRAGLFSLVLLLTAGGAVVTFGLLTSISTAKDLFPMGAGNAAGMLLLSIGYLPNAMVAATSFVAGPGFTLGTVTVSPLEFHGGRLPGVPLLAALPEQQAAWWPALFVFPLAIGIALGRRLRHVDDDPVIRLRAVAIATGVVAVCVLVLAGTAGGRLGRGLFDPVSMRAAATAIVLVLWMAVAGGFTAWFGGPRPATEPMPGLIEPDDEEDAVEEVESEADEEGDEDDERPDVPGPRDAVEESGEVARD